jgi:hypothetical protein
MSGQQFACTAPIRAAKSPPSYHAGGTGEPPPRHPEARSVTSFARACYGVLYRTCPLVYIPLASTFQHQFAAHVRTSLCVVFLPAIAGLRGPGFNLAAPAALPFQLCSTYWVCRFRLKSPTHQVWWAPPMHVHNSCLDGPGGFHRLPNNRLHAHCPLDCRPDFGNMPFCVAISPPPVRV